MGIKITKNKSGKNVIRVTMNHKRDKYIREFPVTKEGREQAMTADNFYIKMKRELMSSYKNFEFRKRDGIIKGVYLRLVENKHDNKIQVILKPKYNSRILINQTMFIYNERHLIQVISEYCIQMKRLVQSNDPPDNLEWYTIDQNNIDHFLSLYRDKLSKGKNSNGDLFQESKCSSTGT